MSRLTSRISSHVLCPASLRVALLELRRPGIGIWALLATLVFAITILTLTVSLTHSIRDGMRQSAQQSIGADISLRLFHRAPTTDEIAYLSTLGTLDISAEQRVMVRQDDEDPGILSELKAIDRTYPLYGSISLDGDQTIDQALVHKDGVPGAVVGREVLSETGWAIGDVIALGDQRFEIRATIASEPDRKFRLFSLGPRILVSLAPYRQSGLMAPGKQIYWYARIKLPPADIDQSKSIITNIENRFPNSGWRIVDAADGVPGIERIGDFASAFVSLIGIAIFAIAMTAIHNALRADLEARQSRFAIMRSLGARPSQITASIAWQITLITAIAILISLAFSSLVASLALPIIGSSLGFAISFGLTDYPLILAFVVGFVALTAINPVKTACLASPTSLFRHQQARNTQDRGRKRPPFKLTALACIALTGLLFGLATMLVDLGWFAAILLIALVISLYLFVLLGRLVRVSANRLAKNPAITPSLRLALRNIARPGAPTVTVTASFGLAMTCLFAVILFGGFAGHHLKSALPSETPDLVFFDLPPENREAFRSDATNIAAVQTIDQMPFTHGRVTHVNGTPITLADVPRRYHWFMRGDRGLSWTAQPTDSMRHSPVISGSWWAQDSLNEQLASLDASVAKALDIEVGDKLTLNILGTGYEVTIANLRSIDWTRLGLDFPINLSPMDPPFPHGVINALTVNAHQGALVDVANELRTAYPDVPAISVPDVLAKLNALFDGIVTALVGLTTLATIGAVFVIISGLIALRQRQLDDLAMLRALGIQPRQITRTGALETTIMLGVSGIIGILAGTAIAVVAGQAIGSISLGQIVTVAGPIGGSSALIIAVVGFAGGWALQASALRTQPGWRG